MLLRPGRLQFGRFPARSGRPLPRRRMSAVITRGRPLRRTPSASLSVRVPLGEPPHGQSHMRDVTNWRPKFAEGKANTDTYGQNVRGDAPVGRSMNTSPGDDVIDHERGTKRELGNDGREWHEGCGSRPPRERGCDEAGGRERHQPLVHIGAVAVENRCRYKARKERQES